MKHLNSYEFSYMRVFKLFCCLEWADESFPA